MHDGCLHYTAAMEADNINEFTYATNEDYRLLSCRIRSLQIQREELRIAVAQKNAELAAAVDVISDLEEQLDEAREQLRVRGLGIPFADGHHAEVVTREQRG